MGTLLTNLRNRAVDVRTDEVLADLTFLDLPMIIGRGVLAR